MCKVINILHSPYYFDIYIGYTMSGPPPKWGNQFDVAGDIYQVAQLLVRYKGLSPGPILDVGYAILMYREWLLHTPEGLSLQEDIDELRGKVLGCFCKPHLCHGDVLVELLGQRDGT